MTSNKNKIINNNEINQNMPFKRKYSDEKLSNAILMVLDQGMSPNQVSISTGINIRTLQRHKRKYVDDLQEEKQVKTDYPAVFKGTAPVSSTEVQKQLDQTMLARAKFLEDVFNVKQKLLKQLDKVGGKSNNVDALQRSIKTLNDIEKEVTPEGDAPMVHAKTVNVFQLFNQNLEKNGYKGPELTDADIVKGD